MLFPLPPSCNAHFTAKSIKRFSAYKILNMQISWALLLEGVLIHDIILFKIALLPFYFYFYFIFLLLYIVPTFISARNQNQLLLHLFLGCDIGEVTIYTHMSLGSNFPGTHCRQHHDFIAQFSCHKCISVLESSL